MKLALRELIRRPARFASAAAVLTLISLLLMLLGGILDGLIRSSTGAVRAQASDLIVFSSSAKSSFLRSRIDATARSRIEAAEGVVDVGGIAIVQLGARIPGKGPRDLTPTALIGYELAPKGLPGRQPGLGEAYADDVLKSDGVEIGTNILLGPQRSPITVIGFVSDTVYNGQATLWASPVTWRGVTAANRPDERLTDGVFQALVVRTDGNPAVVARVIDAATSGSTATDTITEAVDAIPGVKEQRATFNQIIGVTAVVALIVVALFFALITVERTGLYGVLKALGARTRTLFAGLVVQTTLVTTVAALISGVVVWTIDALVPPGGIPLYITPGRVLSSTAILLTAAIAGCAFSLRRVLRVDPASAIGGST